MSAGRHDVVIVGAGPAGLAAAAVVAGAGLRCATIDRMGPGGQLMNLGALIGVEGVGAIATGPDLIAHLVERAVDAGAELLVDDVSVVTQIGEEFAIEALEGRFEAAAVIIATGLTPGTTGLEDEDRFEGLGLSHCAHCDAPLFAGQPVVVTGRDAWAVEEALELAGHASSVTLVADDSPQGPAERLQALCASSTVSVIEGRITALEGGESLEGVWIEGANGSRRIAARGLFPQTGRVPALGVVTAHVAEADGCFIAGDARENASHTIAVAIADGRRAGQNAIAWVKARAGT